ncbi:MAG: YesL family protein [Lachnospiraceae bacterium]|nr:YesL family protein [Lachnospiraceae bacterium]
MRSILDSESKPLQFLATLGDYILLNVIYILCCLPVFTTGAAQAGLYTALRSLDPDEGDKHFIRAFFRGFKAGFLKITLLWLLVTLPALVVGYLFFAASVLRTSDNDAASLPTIFGVAASIFGMLFGSVLTLFHSRFECTGRQLMRNVMIFLITHPLRSIGVGILTWGPVALLFVNQTVQAILIRVFIIIYYSAAFRLSMKIMSRPFDELTARFNKTFFS